MKGHGVVSDSCRLTSIFTTRGGQQLAVAHSKAHEAGAFLGDPGTVVKIPHNPIFPKVWGKIETGRAFQIFAVRIRHEDAKRFVRVHGTDPYGASGVVFNSSSTHHRPTTGHWSPFIMRRV
ncbi:jg5137 [Pararge aegeria aegeria]|uniref:Jg5137 protein n=1 Tax=Pararge aegeria aegeria TaxID=348720 RepID=A0A8S4S4B4_9NEOP|nr:jg5137 [Pararge aegeria aegeria]